MGDKDLENIIRAVESAENEGAQKMKEMARLYELTETQKLKIDQLEKALQEQAVNLAMTTNLSPDVELLKQRVSDMRTEINQKDALLEAKFVETNRLKSDLNFLRSQLNETSQDVQRYSSEAARLRETIADFNKRLEEKTQALQANTDTLAKKENSTSSDGGNLREIISQKDKQLEEITQELQAKTDALAKKEIRSGLEGASFRAEIEDLNKRLDEKTKELQAKTDAVARMEPSSSSDFGDRRATIEELKKLLEEKTQELQAKTDTLAKMETSSGSDAANLSMTIAELNKLLEEKTQELRAKTDALEKVETSSSSDAASLRAAIAEKNKQLEEKTQELQAKTDALAKMETTSYDVLKLREDLQATQSNLLTREKLILEKDAKIADLEGKTNQSQANAVVKEEIEMLRGELSAKDFDLKMQEGTVTELREQLEENKRRAELPDPNAGRIDALSKQLQQMHNENAKLSLQLKIQDERMQEQQARIVALESAPTAAETTPSDAKVLKGNQLTKKIVLHTTTKEERHFEI